MRLAEKKTFVELLSQLQPPEWLYLPMQWEKTQSMIVNPEKCTDKSWISETIFGIVRKETNTNRIETKRVFIWTTIA